MLTESLKLLDDEEEPNPWRGYNRAFLGKLYLEWPRVEYAAEPLLKGWQEIKATWFVALVPLVRNYYAELLMHPDYEARDPIEADNQLNIAVEESKASGFHRSAVAALTLRSRLALMQKRVSAAVIYSTDAVDYLRRFGGTLPALRTEEVLFNHYSALKAAGQNSEALTALEEAYTVLQQKALSIEDKDHRKAFLEQVTLSRKILSAHASR